MSLFKELLDPQHRRRRTRGPIEYTDVEAAESLQPQRQLAMLMRDVTGAEKVLLFFSCGFCLAGAWKGAKELVVPKIPS